MFTTRLCRVNRKPATTGVQVRCLNLQEFQSKGLMDKFGVRTQKWIIASTVEEAVELSKANLKAKELVVKAQVLAGGRGKGHFTNGFKGGVHLCNTAEEAGELTKQMLGSNLITAQTPPEGVLVNKVMIAEAIDLKRELYLSILMDRDHGGPVYVASQKGGMDIEEVARTDPGAIITVPVDIRTGPTEEQLVGLATSLGFKKELIPQATNQLRCLYDMFLALDCTQVEVNPFAETPEGEIYAADAKMNFDDNASFRQKEVFAMHNTEEDDPREVAAAKFNLNYIGMTGNIGCMVNGAGLAMATMDIIQFYNGAPANFLDVGGGANEQQVTEAFKILNSDPQVKAILVNIFGGIMKCDIIAAGVVAAAKTVGLSMPLIVRLEGIFPPILFTFFAFSLQL
eukprot:TRINITY_DN40_c0_g1_i1.p1 TRINITY_DN40_c0_g1~~TRINITY_DN40_c0_g1_i1.p1  ORF type:complete len:398 (-),score=109.63 TRINITY_DN40_c0_g1_i1:42-1235(-)